MNYQEIFGAEGPLARAIPGYAHRSEQTAMAGAVGRALTRGEPLIVEAGTGTGKTFAYLVPALLSGLSVIIWQLIGSGSRFMRREIIPVLARSLAPLQPTQQELEAVVNEIRQGTHKIGRKVKPEQVLEQIQASVGAIGGVPRLLG